MCACLCVCVCVCVCVFCVCVCVCVCLHCRPMMVMVQKLTLVGFAVHDGETLPVGCGTLLAGPRQSWT